MRKTYLELFDELLESLLALDEFFDELLESLPALD
jgi:hypothetical protein